MRHDLICIWKCSFCNSQFFWTAQYSRELSDKVWRGCVKIAEQGYLAGGKPRYGLSRLLLDEKREPLNVLDAGQRKGIQNQRVTLIEGPPERKIANCKLNNANCKIC